MEGIRGNVHISSVEYLELVQITAIGTALTNALWDWLQFSSPELSICVTSGKLLKCKLELWTPLCQHKAARARCWWDLDMKEIRMFPERQIQNRFERDYNK